MPAETGWVASTWPPASWRSIVRVPCRTPIDPPPANRAACWPAPRPRPRPRPVKAPDRPPPGEPRRVLDGTGAAPTRLDAEQLRARPEKCGKQPDRVGTASDARHRCLRIAGPEPPEP